MPPLSATPQPATDDLPWRDALRYGALGAPLAFVALPLYVQWPAFASQAMGLSLATLGTMLLVMRCLDAVIDPWLGARVDSLLARPGPQAALAAMALACVAVAAGFAMLFVAPGWLSLEPALWVAGSMLALALTYLGFSFAQIAHQAWGARLGGDEGYRAQVVGARELFALLGVVVASVAPTLMGWDVITVLLMVLLALGLGLLARAPTSGAPPPPSASTEAALPHATMDLQSGPWRHREFRLLLAVHAVNGLASAIPATLVLFFVRDRLELRSYEGFFLLAYFVAAAASVPLWTRLVEVLGLVKVWASGMVLAIIVFAFAAWLGPGDAFAFALVCLGSGLALGAELVAPPALLAGVIQRSGLSLHSEGLWFGWWNLFTKLSLALAAGLALPLVEGLGYRSGAREAQSLQALVWVYALVPCAIKALALLLLVSWRRRVDVNDAGLTTRIST